MKINILLAAIFTLISLSGCVDKFEAKPTIVKRLNSDMETKVKYVKFVGDAVVNKYDYTEKIGITVTQDFEESLMTGKIYIPKGAFLPQYKDVITEENYYCGKYIEAIMSSKPTEEVCLIENDRRINKYYKMVGKGYTQGPYTLSETLDYKKAGRVDTRRRFRKIELIYDGMYKGMLLFTYREFVDSSVRPSFSSKIRYRKKRGVTQVTYRSANIRVYRANSNKIEYMILTPLHFGY